MSEGFTASQSKSLQQRDLRGWLRKRDKNYEEMTERLKLSWAMEHNLPLNDERLLSLRVDEVSEQLALRNAWKDIEHERMRAARKRAQKEMERTVLHNAGLDNPEVEVLEDEEAQNIADSPLPGTENDPEWAEWERQNLDPIKDL